MDWVPTLLSAAGGRADPHFPMDGIDLLAKPKESNHPDQRTLFWRYSKMHQEACRSGDWKYLKINDNVFLFNLKKDPLERANLKELNMEKLNELVSRYREWDSSMLPLDPKAYSFGFTGEKVADHFGNTP